MAITEQWMPSPNYSASRGPYNVIALHTTEGAMDITSLGNWFAQSSAQIAPKEIRTASQADARSVRTIAQRHA